MKICYVPRRFRGSSLRVVEQANVVVDEYVGAGYRLTLRQIYYQFVARDLFPDDRWWRWIEASGRWARAAPGEAGATKNAEPNYRWLGSILNDARLAGLVDWEAIEDRTRTLRGLPSWGGPAEIVSACAEQFRTDAWADQPVRVEVWIEKEALAGVFERPCNRRRVPFFCCRGYPSASEVWAAATRLRGHAEHGQEPVVLHLGDHDPSGIDMSRDIRDRLRTFGVDVDFRRVALNMDQVEEHRPPPNPAKDTDARFEAYRDAHGDESWELDALEPQVLAGLVDEHVEAEIDWGAWGEALRVEEAGREALRAVADGWPDVVARLQDG